MQKIINLFLSASIIFVFTTSASAALFQRGNDLVYDSDLNITWLQNANYSGNTMSWADAQSWSSALVFEGYDDWRLPSSDTSCSGKNCIASEMGHLFYSDNISSASNGLFSDVKPYMYWSGTELQTDPTKAWRFGFDATGGSQGNSSKTLARYGWAVRDGDSMPVAPEPISSILFLSGGVTLSAMKFRKKRNNT